MRSAPSLVPDFNHLATQTLFLRSKSSGPACIPVSGLFELRALALDQDWECDRSPASCRQGPSCILQFKREWSLWPGLRGISAGVSAQTFLIDLHR
jgi:hypothetical protein